MGSSSYSHDAYSYFSDSVKSKPTADVFKSKVIDNKMDPKGIIFRECRDSINHPESLAVIITLDVTGSMRTIPEIIVREKLDKIMQTLIDHGVLHASVLFSAIGDHNTGKGWSSDTGSDKYPFQIGQFESGTTELLRDLTSVVLEGGGGGNDCESYCLAHFFAGKHTSIDCYEKRGQKGFLFTIGDEKSHTIFTAEEQIKIFGYEAGATMTDKEMLASAQRLYHVFHIHANQTGYKDSPDVLGYWKDLLGQRLIIMDDYNNVSEIIASTIAVMNGVSIDTITASFDHTVASSVKNALAKVDMGINKLNNKTGIVAL